MTRTIWLASYPKSGNTWLRLLIANLAPKDGRPSDINRLPDLGGIASARRQFDYLLLIDSGLLTHEEIDALRPRLYEARAGGASDDEMDAAERAQPVRYVKVHDAYTLTASGEPLLAGRRGASGAIVIVRDPRDVAPSLASHARKSIDNAIAFMNDDSAAFSGNRTRQQNQLRQQLLGWSRHVASWLDQRDIPVLLVRYEDLKADTAAVLARALSFAGHPATEVEIRQAVAFSEFSELRRQEQAKGFREAPRPWPGGGFFRRGEAGSWRDELTPAQVALIEAEHAPMMRRLGYQLSQEPETHPPHEVGYAGAKMR